ncbi:MAG: hypothetical protein U0931_38640 [Vulcanimicrobiota bacterium]
MLIVAEPRSHRQTNYLASFSAAASGPVASTLAWTGPLNWLPIETCADLTSPRHIRWLLASLGWADTGFVWPAGTEAFCLSLTCPHRLLDCQQAVEQVERWKPKSKALQEILESW